MIDLEIKWAFIIYLFIWFFGLAFLWGREFWRSKIYDWALSEGSLCICDRCHYAFLVKPRESASRCPKCDEVCTVKKRKRT